MLAIRSPAGWFLALALAGCGGWSSYPHLLANSEWQLVRLGEIDSPAEAGGANIEFTTVADMTGWTGCNSYRGRYSVRGPELLIADLHWTEAGCPSDALFRQEQLMQTALSAVQSFEFELEGDRLTLYGGGKQLLVFERTARGQKLPDAD